MRLTLLNPPVLVAVEDAGGVHPALLIGTRADRCFVQLSRGPGLNHLRWVDAGAVARTAAHATLPAPPTGDDVTAALPWIRTRAERSHRTAAP